MRTTKTILSVALFLCCLIRGFAQVSVVSIQLMPYNTTPESMLAASVINNGAAVQVQMVSKLYNSSNEVLLTVSSSAFLLKPGLNPAFDGSRKAIGIEYGSGSQPQYIKSTHTLPTGTFRICVSITSVQNNEIRDEYCDETISDFSQFLYLVNPFDKDTVDSKTPLLIWSHSEPFNVLAQGEYYRMVVSEIKDRQNAEEAVTVNPPLMAKNYLTVHSIQYPYDAKELREGMRYAWQVQKIANGIISNKTEAWEFIIRKKPSETDVKYVALRQTMGSDYYKAVNGRVYFKFNEEYNSKGTIRASITSDKGKEFLVEILKDEKNKPAVSTVKTTGDNRFVLDLDKEQIKPGHYTMLIRNEKKETFYLKFYLPE